MTSSRKTTKPKQIVGIFSNNSGKHTTTKDSFPWKVKIVRVFQLPFQFLTEKINRFLNTGKLVSVTTYGHTYGDLDS